MGVGGRERKGFEFDVLGRGVGKRGVLESGVIEYWKVMV